MKKNLPNQCKWREINDSGSALERYKTWNALKRAMLRRYCLAQASNKRSKGIRHSFFAQGFWETVTHDEWQTPWLRAASLSQPLWRRSKWQHSPLTALHTFNIVLRMRLQKPFVSGFFFRINTFWEKVVTHSVCLFIFFPKINPWKAERHEKWPLM